MADWLLLKLPASPDEQASWLVADARGASVSGPETGPLDLAAVRAASKRVCVLVPGSDVLLTQPILPVKAGTKLSQIVPYALEEHLAEDIDQLHFAMSKVQASDGTVPVAVVSRALMDQWQSDLGTVGIQAERFHADRDLLPENPRQLVALLQDDLLMLRRPGEQAITLPATTLAHSLRSSAAPIGLILYTGAAEWQRYAAQVEALRPHFDGIKVQLLTAGPLGLFAQQLPYTHAINLLQSNYTPRHTAVADWRRWRVAAILLATLLGVHIAGKAVELGMLKRSERTLNSAIDEAFRKAMPGEKNSVDARRRMQQRLASAQSGGPSSELLSALEALVQARGGNNSAMIQVLNFRQGAVDLQLNAADADVLEKISQRLRREGWQADLTAGSATDGGYKGRIQLRQGAGS
jgi:general secretion pathway protein L